MSPRCHGLIQCTSWSCACIINRHSSPLLSRYTSFRLRGGNTSVLLPTGVLLLPLLVVRLLVFTFPPLVLRLTPLLPVTPVLLAPPIVEHRFEVDSACIMDDGDDMNKLLRLSGTYGGVDTLMWLMLSTLGLDHIIDEEVGGDASPLPPLPIDML